VTRRRFLVVGAMVVVLALTAGVAMASWLSSGVGGAAAQADTVPQGNTPVAVLGSTGGVDVSWAAAALVGQSVTYDVQRHDGTAATDVTACQDITAVVCFDDVLEAGTYTYTVTPQVNPWVGATSAPSNSVTIAAGNAPPTPTITIQPSDPTYGTTATFEFSSTSATSYTCKLDSGAFESCSAPKVYSSVGSGSHTFAVKAANAEGPSAAATHSWTSITLPPDAPSITAGPDDPSTSAAATFDFGSARATGYTCKLDGAASFTACTSPKEYTSLSEGQHTFSVTASNPLGESTPTSFSWTVDTQAPGLPALTVKPASYTSSTAATFEFSGGATNLPKTYKCKLDAAGYSSCTSPKEYTGLADGAHTFSVVANNANGDSAPSSHTWTVDTAPPTIQFTNRTTPNAAGWNNTNVTVNWSCADALSGPALPSVSQSLTTEGADLSATGTCTDLAGNTASNTQTGIKIDKTGPTTTDNSTTIGNTWRNADATVTLTPSAAISGAKATYYTVDGSAPTTSSAQGTSVALTTTGTYTVKYFTVDNAGNAEAVQTAGTQIRIDKTSPSTPLFGNPTPALNSSLVGSKTWSISAPSDTGGAGLAGVQFEYRVKTNATDAFPTTWTPMGSLVTGSPWEASLNTATLDKAHLEVRARTVDNAGNSATTAMTYTVRPQIRDVQLVNKTGGIAGRMEPGDQIAITYSQAIKTSTGCLDGKVGLGSGGNQGSNDRFDMLDCKMGQVRLQANYVSGDVSFTNTVANWGTGDTVLTITLGSLSAADILKTNINIAAAVPTLVPTADLKSYADVGFDTTITFTAATSSRF
jgi:hypothetical protein